MHRVGRVAIAGALIFFGGAACTAEAETGAAPDGGPSASPTVTGQGIRVTLSPAKTAGGSTKSIRIRAFCPLPAAGTEHRATARSQAFTGVVTLTPPPQVTPTGEAAAGQTAEPVPEVRGFALLSPEARPAVYEVEVRCETNETGTARLTITEPTSGSDRSESEDRSDTTVPTKAPEAGGGGTATGGP